MTKYVKAEMNDLNGTGKTKMYYRIPLNRNMDAEDTVDWMRENCAGMDRGEARRTMQAMSATLASLMSLGYSVTLEGIGTFRPRLGLVEGRLRDEPDSPEPGRNAQSLQVCGVCFKPDKRLVRDTGLRCRLESGGEARLHVSDYSEAERLALAVGFLQTSRRLRVRDYARLTGLSQSTAQRELRRLAAQEDSPLATEGRATHRVYVLRD